MGNPNCPAIITAQLISEKKIDLSGVGASKNNIKDIEKRAGQLWYEVL